MTKKQILINLLVIPLVILALPILILLNNESV